MVGCHERMTRSESFLLKVQGGELDVDRLSETEMASVILAFVVGHHERMTRSESFLLKVQGGELDDDRMSWSEAANAD